MAALQFKPMTVENIYSFLQFSVKLQKTSPVIGLKKLGELLPAPWDPFIRNTDDLACAKQRKRKAKSNSENLDSIFHIYICKYQAKAIFIHWTYFVISQNI